MWHKNEAAFQQSILQAAAKREIIAIQVKDKYFETSEGISHRRAMLCNIPFILPKSNVP
jgi:hypothetical protein